LFALKKICLFAEKKRKEKEKKVYGCEKKYPTYPTNPTNRPRNP
jgi:hypothetical protein